MALDIDPDTLDEFAKYPYNEALIEVLKVWIKGAHQKPTWEGLVAALRSEYVSERILANEVARKHCPSEVEDLEAGNCNNCLICMYKKL